MKKLGYHIILLLLLVTTEAYSQCNECRFTSGARVANQFGEIGTIKSFYGNTADVLFDDTDPRGTVSPRVDVRSLHLIYCP